MVRFGEKRWSCAPPFLLPLIEQLFYSITLIIIVINKDARNKRIQNFLKFLFLFPTIPVI